MLLAAVDSFLVQNKRLPSRRLSSSCRITRSLRTLSSGEKLSEAVRIITSLKVSLRTTCLRSERSIGNWKMYCRIKTVILEIPYSSTPLICNFWQNALSLFYHHQWKSPVMILCLLCLPHLRFSTQNWSVISSRTHTVTIWSSVFPLSPKLHPL